MKKKILLTGSTGFVGKQVLKALSLLDIELRLVVRKGTARATDYKNLSCEIVETKDLFSEDINWWTVHCTGIDTVIHLAWYAEPGKYLQSPKNFNCLSGSLNLARGAVKAGVRRFIGIGTCFEYDVSYGTLSVDTPLKPSSPYAEAKTALYLRLLSLLPRHGIEFAWCRIFYLYGEGEDTRRLVAYVLSKLKIKEPAMLTSGKQIRDYLDVKEAGSIIAKVALGKFTGPVNVCSGKPITVRELVEQLADKQGAPRSLLKFGGREDNSCDPQCVIGIPNV